MTVGNATTDDTVGWQTGPEDRGTVTLVWGCVTTIFACSWTILHLNVPALTDSAWTRILRKTKWMAITIVFPEFILSKAICDLRLALRELCEFDEYLRSDENDVKWRASYKLLHRSWEDEWNWRVEYPRYARLIYRLLVLKPPVQKFGERLSSSNEGESEGMELTTLQDNEEQQHQGENPTPSDKNARSGREIDTTQSILGVYLAQKTQVWTVVHSYFAQMGGLAYINKWEAFERHNDDRRTPHEHFVLTASKLTPRYKWLVSQPLQHLVLGKDDIEDKSKADSFVKSIAVLQIAWLVLNVIARAIKTLPITQLEIATIAFALMAILTYAINWWKPKDVSQPILLLHSCLGVPQSSNLMQSFMTRLRRTHQAAQDSRQIPILERVPNDLVWMEGKTPLFYQLLGITSLVFGSLHCIAWNFQFPTRTELLCWRVVNLLSATLPGAALGLSMVMGYLRTNYLARKRTILFSQRLQPLESISEEWWEHRVRPKFREWNSNIKAPFMAMTKYLNTDWEVEPSREIVEELELSEKGAGRVWIYSRFKDNLEAFHDKWKRRQNEEDEDLQFGQHWLSTCGEMGDFYGGRSDQHGFQVFWRGCESFVEKKLGIPPADRFETSCVDTIMKAYKETSVEVERLEARLDLAVRIVEALNGCGGIIYVACRLMTIVLLFTCLRATPAGVYQVVPWTTFIPGIS